MAFERQYDPPGLPGPGGLPGGLKRAELERLEKQAAAILTRLYETNDSKAFDEFLDLTQDAMVATAGQVADALGWCLGLEDCIADVYSGFLLDLNPRPDDVLHSLHAAQSRLMSLISKHIAEVGDLEIEPDGSGGAQVTGDRIPKPLLEVEDAFQRVIHVCTHRLDTKHRRVLRFKMSLGLGWSDVAERLECDVEDAKALCTSAMGLLDTSVTLATGSDT